MAAGKTLAFVAVAAAVAGAAARRRRRREREHVELYFDDGSMVSLSAGSQAAAPFVSLARAALAQSGHD